MHIFGHVLSFLCVICNQMTNFLAPCKFPRCSDPDQCLLRGRIQVKSLKKKLHDTTWKIGIPAHLTHTGKAKGEDVFSLDESSWTLDGVPAARVLFKNFFVAFLFQWRVKERLLKARSKLWLHKHWQRHKKLNPCCLRVKLSYGNYLSIFPFGGLASEGDRGIRLGKEAKLIRWN